MAITRAQQVKQMLKKGGRTGFFIGSNFDPGSTRDAQKTSSKGSTRTTDRGGNDNYNYTGPADLGVTTRQGLGGPSYITPPKAYEIIGGNRYDVTPDNKEERRILNEIEKDKKEKIKDTFIDKPAEYPGYIPPSVRFLADLNRKPNRKFFYDRVVKAGKYPGLNYGMTAQQFEEAYEQYMSDRMSGKIDAVGNPTRGFSYDAEGNLTGNFIDDNDGGSILPVDTTFNMGSGDMNQGTDLIDDDEEDTLEGLRRRFRADGGIMNKRIGLFKGAVASGENISPGTDVRGNIRDDNPLDRGGGGGGGGPPVDVEKERGFNIVNAFKNFRSKVIGGLGGFDPEVVRRGKLGNLEEPVTTETLLGDTDDSGKNILDTLAGGIRYGDEIVNYRNSIAAAAKELGYAEGGPVGGIMDLESGRQMYFLGKLVKKATRAVKKIAKSPIGKIALLYTGAGGLGNLAAGKGFFGGAMSNIFKPTTFLGNVPKIFSGEGVRNILVGRPESIISPGGKDIFRQAATKGLFGIGGKLDALKAISAVSTVAGLLTPAQEAEAQRISDETGIDIEEIRANPDKYLARRFRADGGLMRLGYQEGGDAEPVAKKTMPLIDMDGKEKDYRETGGFVDMGRMERADDVPARLSKNEFVFTADAVRNAGDGSVDKGAEVMYNMMKNLEAGGEVSEESQGLEGARKMFQTSQRLEEVL